MIVVLISSRATDMIVAAFVPPSHMIATAQDRVYRVYECSGPVVQEFRDLDGDLLISSQSFPTLDEAKAWVERDAAERRVLLAARRVVS